MPTEELQPFVAFALTLDQIGTHSGLAGIQVSLPVVRHTILLPGVLK